MADYRKMWEDLGMDVETHDQLCAVLPQAFGDVFLSQENRPEGDVYKRQECDMASGTACGDLGEYLSAVM